MQNKRTLITAVVVALLAILIYSQVREWRDFDWATFWAQTHHIRGIHILHAIVLIYSHYGLRALRWRILHKPLKKDTSWLGLIPPTLIGFTGLALLGRPGEFIRPYLIARREGLSLSSQIAVWTVERIFDLGAFTSLMVAAIFVSKGLRELSFYAKFRDAGFVLMAGGAGLSPGLVVFAQNRGRGGPSGEGPPGGLPAEFRPKVTAQIHQVRLGPNPLD